MRSLPGVEVIWRQDCYQLPTGRTSFGFKDGIGQPAVEGSGRPPSNPKEKPLKAGEIVLGYPDETGSLPPMPAPEVLGRNGTYVVFRKLHTRVAAYRQYLRAKAASREEEALLGAKMVGRWQSGAPLALAPDGDDPDLGGDPQRNNAFLYGDDPRGLQVPGRRARTARESARRARPRRRRRRAPAPHDPARHELRADAARRRARGRRRRPGHHLRLRRRAPQAPVRVRQDPMAERRHLHRRPAREGPARRAERRLGQLHRSSSGRSGAGCRTCRRSSSPAAASTASPQACGRCAGWRSSTRDSSRSRRGRNRGNELGRHRSVEGTRLRPTRVRWRRTGVPGPRRLPRRRSCGADHPQPAARGQRDHDRDGRPPHRDRRDDRGPARHPRRRPHRSR